MLKTIIVQNLVFIGLIALSIILFLLSRYFRLVWYRRRIVKQETVRKVRWRHRCAVCSDVTSDQCMSHVSRHLHGTGNPHTGLLGMPLRHTSSSSNSEYFSNKNYTILNFLSNKVNMVKTICFMKYRIEIVSAGNNQVSIYRYLDLWNAHSGAHKWGSK